jgi:hypothetical protein
MGRSRHPKRTERIKGSFITSKSSEPLSISLGLRIKVRGALLMYGVTVILRLYKWTRGMEFVLKNLLLKIYKFLYYINKMHSYAQQFA